MELVFNECAYGMDFESIESPPISWGIGGDEPGDPFIWFKAYDTSMCENYRECKLHESGYKFDCLAWVEFGYMGRREYLMQGIPARNQEEAERLLQACADAIYEED